MTHKHEILQAAVTGCCVFVAITMLGDVSTLTAGVTGALSACIGMATTHVFFGAET